MVTSARRSGTRQQSAGRTSAAIAQHLLGHRHLQVHVRLEQAAQHAHVAVLDVAAVLAQVQRDAVGTGSSRRRARRAPGRAAPAARLAQASPRDRCSHRGQSARGLMTRPCAASPWPPRAWRAGALRGRRRAQPCSRRRASSSAPRPVELLGGSASSESPCSAPARCAAGSDQAGAGAEMIVTPARGWRRPHDAPRSQGPARSRAAPAAASRTARSAGSSAAPARRPRSASW